MANYRVSFFKIGRQTNEETGKLEKTGKEEFIGSVVVDDCGTDEFTIQAKAFRVAAPNCLMADKTVTERCK